ncbi:hypothetical protein SGPA1_11194 [Streptomyces misionensis JCM 4497]
MTDGMPSGIVRAPGPMRQRPDLWVGI